MKKEGNARLAALNAYRDPATIGSNERVGSNNDDEEDIGEKTLPKVSARRDIFSGLPEEEIVRIFKNKFKPMNLYKLRHFHGFKDIREDNSIVIENGSLKSRKTTDIYKDFSNSLTKYVRKPF